MKTCSKCQAQLEVQDQDRDFYNKISPVFNGQKYQIPEPNFCPDCRMQRRLAFRNERSLYRRKCDATSATIISIYSPDKPYKVYQNNYWWGDAWDPMKYGREFDFNRSFTEQFAKLWIEVPMPARTSDEPTMENSEYCNEAGGLKDCYLCFEGALSERCYYSRGIIRCFDCLDCLNCCDCQASYALVECQNCAFCRYIFDCKTCDNCYFCADCSGCSNCFNSVNSRNKKYCFNNVQLTKEEYADRVQKTFGENSYPILLQNFLHYKSSQFTRPFHLINTENCSGDYISNSKNCYHCFSCAECEDCRYCDGLLSGGPNQDCMDISNFGIGVQHCYESQCVGGNPGMTFNALFCNLCWPCDNLFYCHFCVNSTSDCFGCIGLKHGKYCILNKQYTKLEYEKLMAKIIEHMQKTDEWGQFFNPILSPFGHNETVAQEYFPFTKEKAVSKDFKWSDYESPLPEVAKIIAANKLPNSIIQVPNEILDWAIQCELTKKPFRIIKQELDFYRKYDLPLPKRYPEQRHLDRMALRNPRKLWHRVCDNNDCKIEFESSYSHDRPEKVYCEECYKKEIY